MLAHIEYINQDNRVAGVDLPLQEVDSAVARLEGSGMREVWYWLVAA